MSLFVCDECGCIENTATAGPSGYHMRNYEGGDGKARCSECNPEKGKWHGLWPKATWDGETPVVNRVAGTALISEDGVYRYRLSRQWGFGHDTCLFVMLNPSTATATEPDPTITRCIGFTKRLKHERLEVVNLYALRARNPKELIRAREPVGAANEANIREAAEGAKTIVAAWGALGPHERAWEVLRILERHGEVQCLGTTKAGKPRHPLYLPADTPLEPYEVPA